MNPAPPPPPLPSPRPAPAPGPAFGRRLGLGRLAYLAWHRPRAAWARSVRAGGPWNQWLDERGRRAMVAAARRLPAQAAPPANAPEITFLTGRRYWYQTAFCAWSLQRSAGPGWRFRFCDDGSFDGALDTEARRLFPGCAVDRRAELEARLDAHLPEERFPALRRQRRTYVHLRKLTDVHAGRTGWRVVLDSDMLCFRSPDLLGDWLAAPDRPVHLTDVGNAYGYSLGVLGALAGGPVPERVNVGICGLCSDALDWDRIEGWCRALLERHGSSYYLEQALTALILAGRPALALPRADYRVLPDAAECREPTAALHHYVDLSKRGYYRHAWRRFAAPAPASAPAQPAA